MHCSSHQRNSEEWHGYGCFLLRILPHLAALHFCTLPLAHAFIRPLEIIYVYVIYVCIYVSVYVYVSMCIHTHTQVSAVWHAWSVKADHSLWRCSAGPRLSEETGVPQVEQSWSNLHHSEFPSLCDITMSLPPLCEWGNSGSKSTGKAAVHILIVDINVLGLRCSFCS